MKKILGILGFVALLSCESNDDSPAIQNVSPQFSFTQHWDGQSIANPDYEITEYTNANGEALTLSKLVYLISDVTFTNSDGEIFEATDYNLIDARNGTGTTFTPNIQIPEGTYTVSFTYGFDDEDNLDGAYPDLNVADGSWNVPVPLGGGYHYMRLEGEYTNTSDELVAFQFHNIRANRPNETPVFTQDTSIQVDLGEINITANTDIEVQMNVAEWFKNPNQWDLNVLFEVLMPNYDAQIMMNENGQNVFGLGEVIYDN